MANAENLTAKGRGRPKGSPNKVTKAAKDMIQEVAAGLGGADRMLEWVREDPKNEAAFWTMIHPKLLPKEMTGKDGDPLFPKAIQLVGVDPK